MSAGDVYRALWRNRVAILLLTAVCVAAAWYWSSRQDRVYEASTLVRSQQRATDPGDLLAALEASERLVVTYAEIIRSGALRSQIDARIPEQPVGTEPVQLSASPVQDLGLLWISARSTDPARAAIVANAAALTLSDFSKSDALRDEVVVVRRAGVPASAVSPDTRLNVALALLLALVFNSGLVLLFEMLRDRLPETDKLEGELGYPVLATVPALHLRPVGRVAGTGDEQLLEAGAIREGVVPGGRDADGDQTGGGG